MHIGTIGKSQIHMVASRIERLANKNGHNTLTSIKQGRYVLRTDRNDGTYVKTVLMSNQNGVVQKAYSRLIKNATKLKEKLQTLAKYSA